MPGQQEQQPEAPPSYAQATGSSTASSRLQVPQSHNGIPSAARRSMEDEHRPLPAGWVRQWDSREQHQFFVDTNADPPRSIWQHPHDDEDYLKTLTAEERERIQEQEHNSQVHLDTSDNEAGSATSSPVKPKAGKGSGSIGGEAASFNAPSSSSTKPSGSTSSTSQQQQQQTAAEKSSFGRRLKDKVTGTTHEERKADRARREEEERQYYEAHMRFRQALQRAQMTGQPQFLAKDRDGRDVYVEPPQVGGGYGGGYGGYGGYANRGYGYNPYSSGLYADPNARFIRPQGPYGRPYGSGYGGGMGFPIAGGLLGGMLLGGLLF